MLRAARGWVKEIPPLSAFGLLVVFFLGVGGTGDVLGKLRDARIREADGSVHVVGKGLVEGDVAFAETVEDGAEFK